MPFTAAHPAIVLPLLRRRWLSATALVIGSMAPDFEYFFRLKTQSEISHTLSGLFLFNLPVALALCLLFHAVVRDPAIEYLPPYLKKRALAVTYPANWYQYLRSNWFAVSLSAVLGAFSHIFWDSFTHEGLFFVNLLPGLLNTVSIPIIDQKMTLYRVVQHASTAVGATAILWYVHRLPQRPLTEDQRNSWPWFWLLISTAGYLFLLFNLMVRRHLERKPGHMIVTLISGWLLALLLSSFMTWIQQKAATKKG
ncbi:DUF4184 family protein [Pontibacter litorisediminis]|uniref:DUF4184 family protein n=1 Tax=Pontibacter litorisediminis TaxID=1846260 RepID=UPI0023EB477A|nr:DUF4184 family protein [Pontibacter litorisediminis]